MPMIRSTRSSFYAQSNPAATTTEAAGDLLVIIDAGVEGAERPDHAVDRVDVDRHLLDVGGFERLAGGRRGEAIGSPYCAVLVAGVDAAFVVGTKRDPRALGIARDGVEELDLEAGRGFDAVNRCGLVLADGLAGVGVVGRGLLGVRSLLQPSWRGS